MLSRLYHVLYMLPVIGVLGCGPAVSDEELGRVVFETPPIPEGYEPYELPDLTASPGEPTEPPGEALEQAGEASQPPGEPGEQGSPSSEQPGEPIEPSVPPPDTPSSDAAIPPAE